jgi:hypothetical protein
MQRYPSDAEWTQGRVAPLPAKWARLLLDGWDAKHPCDPYTANVELRETTESLLRVRIPLDATDATICEAAAQLAERCAGRAEIFHQPAALRLAMERICDGQGINPPPGKKDGPAIARMCCPLWRRKLRRHHGRTVEAAAILLGHVSRTRDLYCSNETLKRRQQQNARNAASLEDTLARNELGQEFTLAELAAKGPANKSIRRAELMTRIAGFERIARDCAHAGLFMTITCPSRFHKWRTVGGWKVIENPNFDSETNPAIAQKYLALIWSRIRSQLDRQDVRLYGFRIAEPQHDGTPHWHFLVFHRPEDGDKVRAAVVNHALRESPDEPGAQQHRVDFKPIDWTKGSAAGYIAKYVSKNIDGYRLGDDLNGQPATETSARVEAWAATWGIRQFQQVGGPEVGVWRELRRIESLPKGAPAHLVQAHNAVNKVAVIEGRENASVAWDHYCKAQGGVFCGRAARINLSMVIPEKLGRYGDEATPRPVGVETTGVEMWPVPWMPGNFFQRLVFWSVESTRHAWEIVRRVVTRPDARGVHAESAQPITPWTRVNNCTNNSGAKGSAHRPEAIRTVHAPRRGKSSRQEDAWS